MRTMLKIKMEVNAANDAIDTGEMQKVFKNLSDSVSPEANYFTTEDGKRTAYFFFDLNDSSLIPKIAEPLFHHFKAEVEFKPVMNMEDLHQGLSSESEQPTSHQ